MSGSASVSRSQGFTAAQPLLAAASNVASSALATRRDMSLPAGRDELLDALPQGIDVSLAEAVMHVADHAGAIDQERGRHRLDAEHLGQAALRVAPARIADARLLDELAGLQRVLVDVHRDDLELVGG